MSPIESPLPPIERPNGVSSDAPPGPRHVPPFRLAPAPGGGPRAVDAVRAAIVAAVDSFRRAVVTEAAGNRVAAVFRSAVFRFPDDVTFAIRPARGVVAVRSAARLGTWDFGVNRRRVEALRRRLVESGVVLPETGGGHRVAENSGARPPEPARGRPGETHTVPIDGTLDLHTFDPREVDRLLADYLEECRARGILEVRVVHGKGTGVLKARVLARLDRLQGVAFLPCHPEGTEAEAAWVPRAA